MPSGKRVILFGAGASFGSEAVSPRKPPLSATLFDELNSAYPDAWGRIPAAKRELFVPNFEPGMKEIFDSGQHDGTVLLRCIAHYFTQFRASEGNTYVRLFEHLEQHGALKGTYFSSLNYECVLETAARNYGFREIAYYSTDPTSSAQISVWKLHGSCNFLPTSVAGGAAAISYAPGAVSWDGDARIVDPTEARRFIEASAFYPAMAVFMEGKPIQSNPSLVRELQKRWTAVVSEATSVGIVGVSPNPKDLHLWQPLADTKAKIIVIGDSNAYGEWAREHRVSDPPIVVGPRFADSVGRFSELFATHSDRGN